MTIGIRGVARRPGPALEFVAGIARRTRVLGTGSAEPDAWILLDPAGDELDGTDRPVAVWWSEPRPGAPLPACVRVVVSPVVPGSSARPEALPFPYPGVEVRARIHLTPKLRERWRRAARFAEPLTADLWSHTPLTVSQEDRALVLVASAVAARGSLAAEAMATGAPLVTDAATARSLGLHPPEEALVVDTADRAAALGHLASEVREAAVMSRRARRFAEMHLDQGVAADLALRALLPLDAASRVSSAAESAISELARRVTELGVPPSGQLLGSLADRLAVFGAGEIQR
jgi:hypothetical protein